MPPLAPRTHNTPSHVHHISSAAPLPLASPNGLPTVSGLTYRLAVHLPLATMHLACQTSQRDVIREALCNP